MIADSITNSHIYSGLNKKFEKSFQYLKETDFNKTEDGKYEIDGDNIFVMINSYETKSAHEAKPESHIKYIDIQYIISGEEYIGYSFLEGKKPTEDLFKEKDVAFYLCPVDFIKFKKGMFAIFYPDDIHAPGVSVSDGGQVRKVVIKIKIND